MLHRILAVITCLCVAGATLAAAEFWDTKPYLQWSEKEVDKMLTDSPWAVLVAVPLPNVAPVPTADTGGGRRGGGEGRSDFGPGPRRVRLTISWRSALPVKEAAARQQAGKNGTITPEGQAALAREEDLYVIAIQGLPPEYTRPTTNNTLQGLLRREGKPPIGAVRAGGEMTRGGTRLLIGFPRTDPITLADGDVEFEAKLGKLEIRKKFKLKDLVFEGKLAL